jgi:hypothetical protein
MLFALPLAGLVGQPGQRLSGRDCPVIGLGSPATTPPARSPQYITAVQRLILPPQPPTLVLILGWC